MTYIKRDLEPKILSLSKEYSAILITGPRQVGKTTILRQLMQKTELMSRSMILKTGPWLKMILRFSFSCMTVQFLLTKFSMLHSFFHILRSKLTMVPNPAVSGLQAPSHSV